MRYHRDRTTWWITDTGVVNSYRCAEGSLEWQLLWHHCKTCAGATQAGKLRHSLAILFTGSSDRSNKWSSRQMYWYANVWLRACLCSFIWSANEGTLGRSREKVFRPSFPNAEKERYGMVHHAQSRIGWKSAILFILFKHRPIDAFISASNSGHWIHAAVWRQQDRSVGWNLLPLDWRSGGRSAMALCRLLCLPRLSHMQMTPGCCTNRTHLHA